MKMACRVSQDFWQLSKKDLFYSLNEKPSTGRLLESGIQFLLLERRSLAYSRLQRFVRRRLSSTRNSVWCETTNAKNASLSRSLVARYAASRSE